MKELLLSKGFIFNDYDYKEGNFYEYEDENGNEDTLRIARIFGYEGFNCKHIFLCCDESMTEFQSYCVMDDEASEIQYKKDEFKRLVDKM